MCDIPVVQKNARRLENLALVAAEISKSSLFTAVSVYSVHLFREELGVKLTMNMKILGNI